MKLCPRCNNEHAKEGRFCSRSCANSRIQTEEANNKRRQTVLSKHQKGVSKPVTRKRGLELTAKARQVVEMNRQRRRENLNNLPWQELTMPEKRSIIIHKQQFMCALCSLPQTWNGKPLRLELDHVDGDNSNNAQENLRFVCPNCHSQTETYKVGNNKNPGRVTYTDDQIIRALESNTSGYQAMKSLGMNPHGGNYIRVRNIIKKYRLSLPYTV